MQANSSFLSKKGPLDWCVLANIDNGSDQDPLRHLSVKWMLQESFGDAQFVNPRDVCNLETTGFSTDARGERYGYYLTKSVDHPDCPPLPESSNVERMNMMMCYIFRQAQGAHVVDVYGRGMLDLGGDLPPFMGYNGAASMMLCVEEAIKSAEAKRLTWLALHNMKNARRSRCSGIEKSVAELKAQFEQSLMEEPFAEYSYAEQSRADCWNPEQSYTEQAYTKQTFAEKSQISLYSPSDLSPTATMSRDPTDATTATTIPSPSMTSTKASSKRDLYASSKSKDSERSRRQKARSCHVCGKKKAVVAKLMGSKHRRCGICEEPVCGKCYVKRQLLALPEPVHVSCCKVCLVEAKQVDIGPREPCPILP